MSSIKFDPSFPIGWGLENDVQPWRLCCWPLDMRAVPLATADRQKSWTLIDMSTRMNRIIQLHVSVHSRVNIHTGTRTDNRSTRRTCTQTSTQTHREDFYWTSFGLWYIIIVFKYYRRTRYLQKWREINNDNHIKINYDETIQHRKNRLYDKILRDPDTRLLKKNKIRKIQRWYDMSLSLPWHPGWKSVDRVAVWCPRLWRVWRPQITLTPSSPCWRSEVTCVARTLSQAGCLPTSPYPGTITFPDFVFR